MSPILQKKTLHQTFLFFTLLFCGAMIIMLIFLSINCAQNNYDSFAEDVLTLNDGWTLTDSSGSSRSVSLPLTITYGTNGSYILSRVLPTQNNLIGTPALRFYSNYVDFNLDLAGEAMYEFPFAAAPAPGATGNTYHFIRLPADYAGKTLSIHLQCQQGNKITYLLKPVLLGAKATMLRNNVVESLPSILLAGCMLVLAIGLFAMQIAFRRRLKLNNAIVFTALFALMFAVYVFCETSFAQLTIENSYALFCCTLLLLALLPIPLMGLFSEEVSTRFSAVPAWLMLLCSTNLIVQTLLNFTGVLSLRVMLPATHVVIIIAITVTALCLLLSDKKEKPGATSKLLSALPMIAGGLTDIILLAIERPSFNNSLWFTLGVTAFIIIQFCGFVRSFFATYRTSLETELLLDMAYRDAMTNIGNRNAYERYLKDLALQPLSTELGCIVLDINDLKLINDRFGHQAGDTAIIETGRLLRELTPNNAACFRTGGDEFVVLLNSTAQDDVCLLATRLAQAAGQCGKQKNIPLSLAIGCGNYNTNDKNLLDFIRRVDTLMYGRKREIKSSAAYPLQ